MDCIFCQIADGKVPSEIFYQDKEIIAFPDIHPLAPIHVIIIPKKHVPSIAHINEKDLSLIGRMVNVANQIAENKGISDRGYRLVINCGKEGGQMVPHLHLHLLGGKQLANGLT
ncbi:MAG: histidine triad nucleotide-binding protein [Dehalococcoidales bacterium]|nr:histidine triad nucleotide-binding protein [Dehalococcoidales bacterium]